jgi:hypothetical protein
VARKGYGWLGREMGGYQGRWVARKGVGWLGREMGSYIGRWVANKGDGGIIKGSLTRDFRFKFFFMNQRTPDTGNKLFGGVNDTSDKFIRGVVDTGDESLSWIFFDRRCHK